jgi:hypothetical protein
MTASRQREPLHSLARIVAQTPGALLSGALSLAMPDAGGALLAAVSGTALSQAGADVAERLMSPRQEQRIGAVFIQAAAAITARQQLGEETRSDDFFDGDRSNGAEFTEGVLLAARDSYEERKIPYLGNLIANVAFDGDISPGAAYVALRLAEEMSWLDMCILGVFLDSERYPMPGREVARPESWSSWSTISSFNGMTEGSTALLMNKRTVGSHGEPRHDLTLSGIQVSSRGTLVGGLMQLRDIPSTDLRPIYTVLTDGTS